MNCFRTDSKLTRFLLMPLFASTLLLGTACQRAPESRVDSKTAANSTAAQLSAPSDEDIAAQALAAAEAKQAEVELAAAELAAREAAIAEQEDQLRQRLALQEEQERGAARKAALERRERRAAQKETELRQREVAAAERERELQDRERETALAEARQAEAVARVQEGYTESEKISDTYQKESRFEPEAGSAEQIVRATLRPGTVLEVEIAETLSSRTSRVDDIFRSRIVRNVYTDSGELAIPAGSEVVGRVIAVTPLRRVGGQASLEIEFTHLVSSAGGTTELRASFVELGADRSKDKKKIIGAAVAGAILGRILGDPSAKSTIFGAAVGAATGTAVVARAKDRDAEIPAGQVLALELEEVVTVTTRVTGLANN